MGLCNQTKEIIEFDAIANSQLSILQFLLALFSISHPFLFYFFTNRFITN
jgi:hypothetical protein